MHFFQSPAAGLATLPLPPPMDAHLLEEQGGEECSGFDVRLAVKSFTFGSFESDRYRIIFATYDV